MLFHHPHRCPAPRPTALHVTTHPDLSPPLHPPRDIQPLKPSLPPPSQTPGDLLDDRTYSRHLSQLDRWVPALHARQWAWQAGIHSLQNRSPGCPGVGPRRLRSPDIPDHCFGGGQALGAGRRGCVCHCAAPHTPPSLLQTAGGERGAGGPLGAGLSGGRAVRRGAACSGRSKAKSAVAGSQRLQVDNPAPAQPARPSPTPPLRSAARDEARRRQRRASRRCQEFQYPQRTRLGSVFQHTPPSQVLHDAR